MRSEQQVRRTHRACRRCCAAAGFLAVVAVTAAPVHAQTWCTTSWPGAVYCEDFDAYTDGDDFLNEWVHTGPCSSWMALDTDFYASAPYAGKMNTQENGDLGYSVNTIADAIRDTFGASCGGSVIGTDLNPLIVELVMNGQSGRARYDNSFLTIGAGYATAPTDWAWSPFCGCTSSDPRYPIICQQESPGTACPPIGDATARPLLAVGFLAYLDNDPCHCGSSPNSPYNEHLAFFDGVKWYRLRQGLFPGSGDFRVRSNENQIRLTIGLTSIKVELTCPDAGEYSWCELPGYTGPFNTLATGFPLACQLKSGEWECRDLASCNGTVGVPNGGVPRYDNIVMRGGVCYSAPGACCFADTTCAEHFEGDCSTLGGQFAGSGTVCADTACCPPQPADHDLDLDVDMEDFGWFQTCLSGTSIPAATVACRCGDLDHDEDVDADDVNMFIGCLSGPENPADPNCAK